MKIPVRAAAFLTADVPTPVTFVGASVSRIFDLEGVKRVGLHFIRPAHTSGSSTFILEVSNDGTNWVQFNKLIDNVTNTNAQNLTRVASVALASLTSKIYDMDLQHGTYKYMRITATIATDGSAQAIVQMEREV